MAKRKRKAQPPTSSAESSVESSAAAEVQPASEDVRRPAVRGFLAGGVDQDGNPVEGVPLNTLADLQFHVGVDALFATQCRMGSDELMRSGDFDAARRASVIAPAFEFHWDGQQRPDLDRIAVWCLANAGQFSFAALDVLRGNLGMTLGLRLDQIDALPLAQIAEGLEPSMAKGAALPAEESARHDASERLLALFSDGLMDEKLRRMRDVLLQTDLTVEERLTKMHGIFPFPAHASARKLGELFGVRAQAVLKTKWWREHSKGRKPLEIERRRARTLERGRRYDGNDID